MSAWDTTREGRRLENQRRVVVGMIAALLPEVENLQQQLGLSYSALMTVGERREILKERDWTKDLMAHLEDYRDQTELVREMDELLEAIGPKEEDHG